MHVTELMDHLKTNYGQPAKLERQNAYRWEISQGRYPIHLCVTLDDGNDRAVIWVFDPHRPDGHADSIYLNSHDQLDEVLARIEKLVPKGKCVSSDGSHTKSNDGQTNTHINQV